ncbi:hypothetical protein OAK91_05585 [Planctomycetaceae bacterium]|jgi:hypothetical protein|nr:hypothetical protein [Planctomycetaceae bacterium]
MWCEKCQTEVAAEVAVDGSVTCGTCGEILPGKHVNPPDDPLRSAQELLDRWSKEPLLEPLSSPPGKEASHLSESEADHEKDSTEEPADDRVNEEIVEPPEVIEPITKVEPELPLAQKPKFRFDAAHVPEEPPVEAKPEKVKAPDPIPKPIAAEVSVENDVQEHEEQQAEISEPEPVVAEQSEFQPQRVDAAQPVAMSSAPHIDIQQLIDERLAQEKRGINWLVLAGQWLSYLGVLGLTAGAALIVYGYFGGNSDMTPKGWMLTTAGQMLLLLGIVTLISGGLEQSNDEVNTRIELLGEQMLRFERDTKEQLLRGPKIPAAQYAENAKPVESNRTADEKAES